MAANILGVLLETVEVVEKREGYLVQLRAGLNCAAWGDQLTLDHWQQLADLCEAGDASAVRGWAMALVPIYTEIYVRIGYPKTTEEWVKAAEYGDRIPRTQNFLTWEMWK